MNITIDVNGKKTLIPYDGIKSDYIKYIIGGGRVYGHATVIKFLEKYCYVADVYTYINFIKGRQLGIISLSSMSTWLFTS